MNNNNIAMLDHWNNQFLKGEPVKDIMDNLVSQLKNIRLNNTLSFWKEFTKAC